MPGWILPGRRKNASMRYKAILETSLAFSRTQNPRNIEYFWYPLWEHTLSDMVANVPNLIVASQFPIWFVPEIDYEPEDEKNGDDPEEIVVPMEEQEAQINQGDDDDGDGDGDSESNISSAFTIPAKDARSVLVDFAIINLTAAVQPSQRERYGGWRITAASVGLLVEVKRFPSRSSTRQEQESLMTERLTEAKSELIEQAGHLFLQDTKMKSVLAIAATGPYWSGITIRRADIEMTMHRLSARDPSYLTSGEQRPNKRLHWNNALRLDTPRSRDRLSTIYNSLKKMGVLAVPADV